MDKQDELAQCILPILHKKRLAACATSELTDEVAAAVRSFMGSEALPCDVTVAPATVFKQGVRVSTLLGCIEDRRAALSAAIGEDIGGDGE